MEGGELTAQVDVALEAGAVGEGVQVGDLVEELLHAGPLQLQELVHEGHVLLLAAKPVGGRSAGPVLGRSMAVVPPHQPGLPPSVPSVPPASRCPFVRPRLAFIQLCRPFVLHPSIHQLIHASVFLPFFHPSIHPAAHQTHPSNLSVRILSAQLLQPSSTYQLIPPPSSIQPSSVHPYSLHPPPHLLINSLVFHSSAINSSIFCSSLHLLRSSTNSSIHFLAIHLPPPINSSLHLLPIRTPIPPSSAHLPAHPPTLSSVHSTHPSIFCPSSNSSVHLTPIIY